MASRSSSAASNIAAASGLVQVMAGHPLAEVCSAFQFIHLRVLHAVMHKVLKFSVGEVVEVRQRIWNMELARLFRHAASFSYFEGLKLRHQ